MDYIVSTRAGLIARPRDSIIRVWLKSESPPCAICRS